MWQISCSRRTGGTPSCSRISCTSVQPNRPPRPSNKQQPTSATNSYINKLSPTLMERTEHNQQIINNSNSSSLQRRAGSRVVARILLLRWVLLPATPSIKVDVTTSATLLSIPHTSCPKPSTTYFNLVPPIVIKNLLSTLTLCASRLLFIYKEREGAVSYKRNRRDNEGIQYKKEL